MMKKKLKDSTKMMMRARCLSSKSPLEKVKLIMKVMKLKWKKEKRWEWNKNKKKKNKYKMRNIKSYKEYSQLSKSAKTQKEMFLGRPFNMEMMNSLQMTKVCIKTP